MPPMELPEINEARGWDGLGCGRRGCGRGAGMGARGRGRGRMFDNGDLRLVIMHLLSERPRHGYEIIKALEEHVGGGYSPSPGVIYPTLTLLEELGQASVTPEPGGRKLFTLTPEGVAELQRSRDVVAAIFARLQDGVAGRGGPPPPVVRAMENLAAALRLRLQGAPLDEARLHAITAAIDAAARGVEEA